MKKTSKFTAIRDTREKEGHGWWFDENAYCEGTINTKLDVGDYSIQGLEHLLCIERKKSVSEFAVNCGQKRFHKELDRMTTFQHSFLLFEFSWSDIERYPQGSDIPKPKWKFLKIKHNYMMSIITKAQLEQGIHVIACGDKRRAEEVAFRIMRKAYELYA